VKIKKKHSDKNEDSKDADKKEGGDKKKDGGDMDELT